MSTAARNLAVVTLRPAGGGRPARPSAPERKSAAALELARELRLKRKIDQADRVLTKLEARQAKLGGAIAVLQAAKKRAEKLAEKIEGRVILELERANRTTAAGLRVELSTRPCPAAVAITNAALLPAEFVKEETTKTPVKALIKAALSADIAVPGAKLTQGTSLLRKAS